MIEFFLEEPRAQLLLAIGLISVIGSLTYRWGFAPKPLPMDDWLNVKGVMFREIGPQNPEQYEAYVKGEQVGYVRYRFGNLTAEYTVNGDELVFEKELRHQTGQMTDLERGRWLPVVARRLKKRVQKGP